MAKNGKASSNGKAANLVGKKLKRKEDPRLIQGISHYTDDLKMDGMVYCALVRSPHAHAEIKAIRTDAARALPGVVAVFTGEDTSAVGPVPCAMQMPDLKIPRHPVLGLRSTPFESNDEHFEVQERNREGKSRWKRAVQPLRF